MKKILSSVKRDPVLVTLQLGFTWFVRITLVVALFSALWSGNWQNLGLIVFALALTFAATLVERYYSIDIPLEFEVGIIALVYGSLFLGEVNEYYTEFWWWDLLLHTFTGLIVGLVGFMIMFVLYKRKRIQGAPFFIALFSFSLAAAIGGLWEIFEFTFDQLFGLNMQKSGLIDTMWDIIVNDIGALIASIIGFIYLKRGEAPIIATMVRRFRKDNPDIAKKMPKDI